MILYLTIYFVPKLKLIFYKTIVWMILTGMNLMFLCFVLIGYWLLVAEFEGVFGRGYFFGFGLFIFANGLCVICDMSLDRLVKKSSVDQTDNNDEFEDVECGASGCMLDENLDRQNLEALIVRE